MNNKKLTNMKPMVSVGEMAKLLGHSRARFYQLQGSVYPLPIYDIRTKRPYYDIILQQICYEIRETGIGWNGQLILFYAPRNTSMMNHRRSCKPDNPTGKNHSQYQEYVDTLSNMGLDVSEKQVKEAVQKLYPSGIEQEEIGVVIRELFRYFKSGESK